MPDMPMSREDAKSILDGLFSKKIKLDEQWDLFCDATGATSDYPLGDAVWKMFDFATNTASVAVGDGVETVSWYIWDNDLGKKGYEHTLPDGKMKKIKSVDDLLDVIGYPPRTTKRKSRAR